MRSTVTVYNALKINTVTVLQLQHIPFPALAAVGEIKAMVDFAMRLEAVING